MSGLTRPRLKPINRWKPVIELEITVGGGMSEQFFELLKAIERKGSILKAAKEVGLSYKGAWYMIDRVAGLSPRPLIEKCRGGGQDKGAHLTEAGRKILEAYSRVQIEKDRFIEELNADFCNDPEVLQWIRRLIMKSSMRNQLTGKVQNVNFGAVNAEVAIKLEGGSLLFASITNESAKIMELAHGREVLALLKASQVSLVTDMEGFLLSARNQFEGVVDRIKEGPVTSEITLQLPSGDQLVASITTESVENLGLQIGSKAIALFKASAVILGVKRS